MRPLSELERKQLLSDEAELRSLGVLGGRPVVLGDCDDQPGPCPWVGCSANLYLEVDPVTGIAKLNFPDKEVWELEETCAFKVAARGPLSLEGVGKLVNLTQERVSQIEEVGMRRLKRWARGARSQ